ncbi:hypothetical protein [Salinibacter altiplanensis]|uniref:hypothetical protein n=1 Tax=Salinibacter altiplanensis TaxID=1803181 RepID=UPI00131A5721|nr:hypothetical protein [Salinibacter altiplanensis]
MNRDQFLDALAVLARRFEETEGAVGISQEEARALLELFDAGAINAGQLPLPFEEATRGSRVTLTPERAAGAIGAGEAVEAASLAVIEQTGAVPAIALNAPSQQRVNVAHAAMEAFDADVRSLAQDITRGAVRGQDWHSEMIVKIRQHLLQQAQLGKGSPLTPAELDRLQGAMEEQAQFLKRFADEVAVRNELAESAEQVAERRLRREGREVTEEAVEELAEDLRGRAMTEDEIAARARQYKGSSYRAFWEKSEEQVENDDVIIRYIAIDDSGTCLPCSTAEDEGPYLPTRGPMPGAVCLGGGHCRCVRRREVNPEVADSLR